MEPQLVMSRWQSFHWEPVLEMTVFAHLDPTWLAFICCIGGSFSKAEAAFVVSIRGSVGLDSLVLAGPEESMIIIRLMSSELSTVSSFDVKLFIT